MKNILIVVLFLLLTRSGIAQLKLGNAATQLEKSALLELNGNRQGFLLPRLTDTTIINTLNPPDGMLIYFNPASPGKGLYIRKSNRWQRLTTDSLLSSTSNNNWQLTGNSSLTGSEKLGPLNAVTLNLITGNTNRLTIDGTGAISLLGNTSLNGTFTLNPATSTTDLSALLLNSGNTVVKRTLNTAAFDGAIQNINGLTASSQTITTSPTSGTLGFTSSVNTHTLTIPDATTGTRGFVNTGTQSFTGDKTFSNNLTVTGTTTLAAANSTTDTIFLMTNLTNSQVQRRNISSLPYIQSINGSSASAQTITTTNTPGSFTFTGTSGTLTLSAPDADASTRGFVSTGAQTIAGAKTLNSTLIVNNTGATGSSGLTLPKLTNATSETSGAKSIGVDANGVVVRTPTAPTYYTGTGATASIGTVTKVWQAEVTNTATGTFTVTIPSNVGFSTIFNIQVTAKGGTGITDSPIATVASNTTSSVSIRVLQNKTTSVTVPAVIGVLGYTFSVDGLTAHTSTSTTVFIRVEGN